jgi:hypothetical protein
MLVVINIACLKREKMSKLNLAMKKFSSTTHLQEKEEVGARD